MVRVRLTWLPWPAERRRKPGRLDAETAGGRLVECEIVESISYETVSDAEKNELKPWLKECWCLPPQGSAEWEDVLEAIYREYQEMSSGVSG